MVTNMKLTLTNVPFRHDSACGIQKWSIFIINMGTKNLLKTEV